MRVNPRACMAIAAAITAAGFAACSEVADPPVTDAATEGASSHLTFDCSGQGTPAAEAVCDVLVRLYDATNGDGWTDATGWLTDPDFCTWYGVTCWTPAPVVRRLDLPANHLTGAFPAELLEFPNLEAVILGGNELTGEIPAGLADLSQLCFLDLSGNALNGAIPPELGNLSDLETLFLGGNQLTGWIPSELADLPSLDYLDLRQNRLTGAIPTAFGDLEVLHFHLDGNQLSGLVPLPVAERFGGRPSFFCTLENNLGLFMPDTRPYRDAATATAGFICNIELGADTDGDGIPDALDPDIPSAVVATLPDAAFHSGGNRNALMSRLDNIEADIAAGDTEMAVEKLMNLRTRVDGCGAVADTNDWIVDCPSQVIVRDLIDTLIAGLGA